MKKIFSLMILSLLVLSIGAVSAKTLIAGKIYNADYSDTIDGADVIVTCDGNANTTTSLSDGTYAIEYTESKCDVGDTLIVEAICIGSQCTETISGNIIIGEGTNDWENIIDKTSLPGVDVNLGIANVALVPEFGFFVGVLTLLGALGVFFMIRRE